MYWECSGLRPTIITVRTGCLLLIIIKKIMPSQMHIACGGPYEPFLVHWATLAPSGVGPALLPFIKVSWECVAVVVRARKPFSSWWKSFDRPHSKRKMEKPKYRSPFVPRRSSRRSSGRFLWVPGSLPICMRKFLLVFEIS